MPKTFSKLESGTRISGGPNQALQKLVEGIFDDMRLSLAGNHLQQTAVHGALLPIKASVSLRRTLD